MAAEAQRSLLVDKHVAYIVEIAKARAAPPLLRRRRAPRRR
jgi:hypothetical protein